MRMGIGVVLIVLGLIAGTVPAKNRPGTAEWYGEKSAGPLFVVIGLVIVLTAPRNNTRRRKRAGQGRAPNRDADRGFEDGSPPHGTRPGDGSAKRTPPSGD